MKANSVIADSSSCQFTFKNIGTCLSVEMVFSLKNNLVRSTYADTISVTGSNSFSFPIIGICQVGMDTGSRAALTIPSGQATSSVSDITV